MSVNRSFRKVPQNITAKVAEFGNSEFKVSTALTISLEELSQGKFSHLGIHGVDSLPSAVTPDQKSGRYSHENLVGRVIVRRDLPKEVKTYSFDVPSWGDWSKGSHTVYQDRMVYPREEIGPRDLKIEASILDVEQPEGFILLKFSVDQELMAGKKLDERELLFYLNFFSENVGAPDVYPANAKDTDYLATMELNWEILPPGEQDVVISRFLGTKRKVSKEMLMAITERYKLLASMNPTAFIKGTKGFSGYFGAKFGEELVAFEHIGYGNAIYVMHGDWKELSQLSKTELLKSANENYVRIVHRKGWEQQLKVTIRSLSKRAA